MFYTCTNRNALIRELSQKRPKNTLKKYGVCDIVSRRNLYCTEWSPPHTRTSGRQDEHPTRINAAAKRRCRCYPCTDFSSKRKRCDGSDTAVIYWREMSSSLLRMAVYGLLLLALTLGHSGGAALAVGRCKLEPSLKATCFQNLNQRRVRSTTLLSS